MTPTEIKAWRLSQPPYPPRQHSHPAQKQHLSQAGLAQLLGVHPQTVAGWESGRQRPAPYLERALRDVAWELFTAAVMPLGHKHSTKGN